MPCKIVVIDRCYVQSMIILQEECFHTLGREICTCTRALAFVCVFIHLQDVPHKVCQISRCYFMSHV